MNDYKSDYESMWEDIRRVHEELQRIHDCLDDALTFWATGIKQREANLPLGLNLVIREVEDSLATAHEKVKDAESSTALIREERGEPA